MKNPDDYRTKTKFEYAVDLAYQRRDTLTACKERDKALDQVKALQDEVNRLEAELQTERPKQTRTSSEPAYMADGKDVYWTEARSSDSLPGMHHIIFENEEEAKDGLQILNELVKQRDQARTRVAELEAADPTAREDDTEDGGPYSVICERIVGNQIRSDEGVFTSNPASFSAVGFSPNEAEAFCNRLNLERDRRIKAGRERDALRTRFRKMKDLEEQARKGLLSTGPAQILPSGLQVTPVSDGLDMEKALVKVVDIEAMLDQIKARCSAAHYAASCLRDTIEKGGAE